MREYHYNIISTTVPKQEPVCSYLSRYFPEERGVVFCPMMETYRRDKNKTFEIKPIFPGYIFIRSDLSAGELHEFISDYRKNIIAYIGELGEKERVMLHGLGVSRDELIEEFELIKSDVSDEEGKLLDILLDFDRTGGEVDFNTTMALFKKNQDAGVAALAQKKVQSASMNQQDAGVVALAQKKRQSADMNQSADMKQLVDANHSVDMNQSAGMKQSVDMNNQDDKNELYYEENEDTERNLDINPNGENIARDGLGILKSNSRDYKAIGVEETYTSGLLRMSYGYRESPYEKKWKVMEGPLRALENHIVDVNTHNKKAYLDFKVNGRKVRAGFEVMPKKHWFPEDGKTLDKLEDGTEIDIDDLVRSMTGLKRGRRGK